VACKHPPLPTKPGKQNWVDQQGGLPEMIDCVARAIYWESGVKDVSRAIRIAVGKVEDWAAGKDNVTPKTRAKAQAAVASWNAKRARAKADN
jgi:hypothetical protein